MKSVSRWMLAALAAGVLALTPLSAADATCPDYGAQAGWSSLDQVVGGHRYLVFGEASHRLQGIHCLIAEVFRHLAEQKGFRVLVFESAWGVEDALADVLEGKSETLTAEQSFFLNAFASESTRTLLLWIREFNKKHPKDPIRIAGYQPEQPVTDLRALLAHAGRSARFASSGLTEKLTACKAGAAEFKTNLDFLSYSFKIRRGKQPLYSDAERTACNAALDAFDTFLTGQRKELVAKSSANAHEEAQAHLLSFRTYLNLLVSTLDTMILRPDMPAEEGMQLGKKIYTEGDLVRLRIYETLLRTRYGNRKTVLWMHNWHAAKNAPALELAGSIPTGTISLGTRLAEKFGRQLVTIGSVVPCPACETTPPPDAIDKAFQTAFGDQPAVVDLRQALPAKLVPPSPGSIPSNGDKVRLGKVVLRDQFDGMYYLPASGFSK